MSWEQLRDVLNRVFQQINLTNDVPSPTELWDAFGAEFEALASSPLIADEFTELSSGLRLPISVEAARILCYLRQRFNADEEGRGLVGRIRAEAVLKQRPRRDVPIQRLSGIERKIAEISVFSDFSRFQVEGWERVLNAIRNREGLIIVAPTGGGKTEVFMLPIVYKIARALAAKQRAPRFIFLYPRRELLKDQLERIFRYAHRAEQQCLPTQRSFLQKAGHIERGIVIGFQFWGIYSRAQYTLQNEDIFENGRIFKLVRPCPICGSGDLIVGQRRRGITQLQCSNDQCGASFRTSIAKDDHRNAKPHILVTTAESLDRLYLNADPKFENYLHALSGMVFDEVHLYHSLYGVHIHNLIRQIEALRQEMRGSHGRLAKIAASATVSNPARFAAKLFYGDENRDVTVHDAVDGYPLEPAGLEILYFLQSPEEERSPGALSTLIQSVMAIGHGVLRDNETKERGIVFTESLDLAGRAEAKIRDAEDAKRLWDFRVNLDALSFRSISCPSNADPLTCPIYLEGECWRGGLGGKTCSRSIPGLRESPLEISYVSSQRRERYWEGDIVVATPALEVGVDDPTIKATFHYRPPRTVFSFIQRRGRARGAEEIAYTLMILGNTPADHFYLFRRNRLVRGNYELPLNPQNRIIRDMHERLQAERTRMQQHIQQAGKQPEGIWRWFWEKLEECTAIRRFYGQQLSAYRNRPIRQQKGFVKGWVREERQELENYLSLQWTLRQIENESPDELRGLAEHCSQLIREFLSTGGIGAKKQMDEQLESLVTQLGILIVREPDPRAKLRLKALLNNLVEVSVSLTKKQLGIDLNYAQGLHDFFLTLEKLFYDERRSWVLNIAPDVMKIVLQAFFYLGISSPEEERAACPSCIDYFIPEAYFQEVKPIVVRIGSRSEVFEVARLDQEDITSLATLLIPYRTVYRYYPHPLLSILDTEWVKTEGATVTLKLRAEVIRQGDFLIPQRLCVRGVMSDEEGKEIVRMCPECFAVYDVNHRRECHGRRPWAVRLHAEPIVERRYTATASQPITRTFSFLTSMEGATVIYGSDVTVRMAVVGDDGYILTRNETRFEARYDMPIRYSLPTKGLVWNLGDFLKCILGDAELKHRVEAYGKIFDANLVLHTAAHMLHKAIASISGVNEQVLEYWFNPDRSEAVVWERYEGGAGLSEIFVGTLRSNPLDVYRELLASVLCPVHLAETTDLSSPDTLREELLTEWRLPDDDELINAVVREASAERQVRDPEAMLTCQANDGCPACLHTTYCTMRNEQTAAVSRSVGEAILKCLVQRVNREELERLWNESAEKGVAVPHILYADPEQGIYDVLLL